MRLSNPPHLFPAADLLSRMVVSPQQEIFPGAAFVLSISGADSSLRDRSTGRPAEMEGGGVGDVAGCVVRGGGGGGIRRWGYIETSFCRSLRDNALSLA